MNLLRTTSLSLSLVASLALAACGDDDPQTTSTSATAARTGGGTSCPDVQVPGHQAVMVRAQGAGCDVAKAVAAAAEGQGRAPYEARGFSCEGTDASGGDTNYACAMGDQRITFLYGTT